MAPGCCGCCSALRPRYKRLVDSVYPVNPQDGLVKGNMEKLTFYALSSPEKLDRIGEYIFHKATRDIYRRRNGLVIVGMEVMDQLLVACHAQTLNLFVESFLKMVQKLLEATEPELQVLATQSFVKFANIEEDTPSYHRRYDFFVSKFSSMCHNGCEDSKLRDRIRLAGIKGLQGVVRKTVSDDLVENIWEAIHMDKIVPSLLFNMQQGGGDGMDGPPTPFSPPVDGEENIDPPSLAETCMRELVGRASFGNIRAVLRPVLKHFEQHQLWVPNEFAIKTFRIIMYSIQVQYSYAVVEILMSHLDENVRASAEIRTSIARVLCKIIAIAAVDSVGPSVLEIVNSILHHLWLSVLNEDKGVNELAYRDSLINALGEYVTHLPDYHKIEIMMFIMGKVPQDGPGGSNLLPQEMGGKDATKHIETLQEILLRSLLTVGTKYRTVHYTSAFPVSFLDPLLSTALLPNPEVRLQVQMILHTLVDRHDNAGRIKEPTVELDSLDLVIESPSLPDSLFLKKNGTSIFFCLIDSLQTPTTSLEQVCAIYKTLALLSCELGCIDNVLELARVVLAVQDVAVSTPGLPHNLRIQLHALGVSILVFLPLVSPIPTLQTFVGAVLNSRAKKAPHLLPPVMLSYPPSVPSTQLPQEVLVDQTGLLQALKDGGVDTSGIRGPQSFPRHSWVDAHMQQLRSSVGDLSHSFSVDGDSLASSPGIDRRQPEEDLSFDSLKKLLQEPSKIHKEAEEERRKLLAEKFRHVEFSELVAHNSQGDMLQNRLNEIFNKIGSPALVQGPNVTTLTESGPAVTFEIRFPELYVY